MSLPRVLHRRPCLLGVALLCLAAVLSLTHASAETSMQPKIVEQPEFSIIGIQVRTSNAKEMTGQGDIPKQWSKFYKEGIADKIPNKVDSTVYAVYTNYASDYNGEYDFIIGMKVSSASDVPPGMVAKKVPSGRFAVISSAKGPVQASCPADLAARLQHGRLANSLAALAPTKLISSCTTSAARIPQDAQVDLYIGLK